MTFEIKKEKKYLDLQRITENQKKIELHFSIGGMNKFLNDIKNLNKLLMLPRQYA